MISVTQFEIVGPYTLHLTFDDSKQQTIHCKPALHGYYYTPLREQVYFDRVRLDPEVKTLVWPNGADFDPATLHNWNEGDGKEFARIAEQWS